jgi:hypothetical protein
VASRILDCIIGLATAFTLTGCTAMPDRGAAVVARGEVEIVVMDFATPPTLQPLPAGWYHRQFWTRTPMEMSLGIRDGVPAIRLATKSSASMLFRAVDIDLQQYPRLAWRWYIEQPIESATDERTREGDDHPARLFIAFHTAAGETRNMEIIWGNKVLKAGDTKYLGTFPHYVANGGNANVGKWHAEDIDLLKVYRQFWPDGAPARVIDIALFCDSDETRTSSIAWFADVRMRRAPQ